MYSLAMKLNEEETNEIPEETSTDSNNGIHSEKTHYKRKQIRLVSSGADVRKVHEACIQPTKHFKEKLKRIEVEKKPSVPVVSAGVSASRLVDMIDTADREGNAYAKGPHTYTGTYAHGAENKPGKRIPRAGAFAGASTGKARAELSVLDAEANGPNASASAEASVTGVAAMARAELGSVSASAGPLNITLGLGVDTGINVGVDGVGAQFLGTGFNVGPRPGLSLLGSKIECVVM